MLSSILFSILSRKDRNILPGGSNIELYTCMCLPFGLLVCEIWYSFFDILALWSWIINNLKDFFKGQMRSRIMFGMHYAPETCSKHFYMKVINKQTNK